ncbi:hypothetical protein S40293_09610 [Stachybotrys chartarum IBT 40293]|nr:hypothetical protein S40293_09610 [Stachybotrys chartarum IBT 40293]
MPALDLVNPGVSAVANVVGLFNELLEQANSVKQSSTVEPALNKADFDGIPQRLSMALRRGTTAETNISATDAGQIKATEHFAVIETAARDLFAKLLAATPIDAPDFVNMWNFLDIIWMLDVDGLCDPTLLFWLVEELLESQTTTGCRKVFDFLESRRERITSRHFRGKDLVILRCCNELLRRLSRAEDTAFCGRVFIFLFQSFPLGDRSSVNLRGEYHLENVTVYENVPEDGTKMEVEGEAVAHKDPDPRLLGKEKSQALEPNALYPLFWSLQDSFSQPLRLLDPAHFARFKDNLNATVNSFQAIHNDEKPRASKTTEDARRSLKRKRDGADVDGLSETFNPKYLTSRDLFELEISDLSFRRHVLVQALIIVDFLLSLSPQAKEKLSSMTGLNRSVVYNEQLSQDDTKWATEMKKSISDYLKQGFDGPYFYRMVETVLARDRNWVFWKMTGCQAIQRDPIPATTFTGAISSAQRMGTSKRLRPTPLGAVSLDFLKNVDKESTMEALQDSRRYQLPDLDDFKSKIADDDFEISMPTNDETKAAAIAGKSSKSWRALRIASRHKLAAFDKIDDPKKVDVVFEEISDVADDEETADPVADEENMPSNRDPIIISAGKSGGQSRIVEELLLQHKGVFTVVVRHTTREPGDGEMNGKSYHFVKPQEFNQLRDSDRLVEFGTRDGADYGTSSKVIEGILEAGKIPIIELDLEAARFAKDMDFTARYILIKPPPVDATKPGEDNTPAEGTSEKASDAIDDAKIGELFDTVILNDNSTETVGALSAYIFGEAGKTTAEDIANGQANHENVDDEMAEAPQAQEDQNVVEAEGVS